MEIRQVLHDERVIAGFQRAPALMTARVDARLAHWAQRIAAAAKVNAAASAATSNHVNSIKAAKIADLHHEVRSHAAHSRMLEEGTGPAAGRRSYMPNPYHLMAYVKQRAGIRWRGRPGGPARRDQMREVRDRAWALAMHIKEHGTRAHPFLRPAAEAYEAALVADLQVTAVEASREALA